MMAARRRSATAVLLAVVTVGCAPEPAPPTEHPGGPVSEDSPLPIAESFHAALEEARGLLWAGEYDAAAAVEELVNAVADAQ